MYLMDINDFIRQFENARAEIKANRKDEALRIALDLKALIQLRIQTKGENSQGAKFKPYTKGYAKYGRENKGYQSSYFDFTRTGRAFSNILPEVIKDNETTTEVSIGGRSQLTRAKLGGQVQYRGNILLPNKSELDMVKQANIDRIKKYFR